MHENAVTHSLYVVWKFLSEVFPEQWIGQSGPTAWPARAPDINLFIYILGHIKSAVFADEVCDEQG